MFLVPLFVAAGFYYFYTLNHTRLSSHAPLSPPLEVKCHGLIHLSNTHLKSFNFFCIVLSFCDSVKGKASGIGAGWKEEKVEQP